MRDRRLIAEEANEARHTLNWEGGAAPDVPRLLTLLLEVALDIREMYRQGHRPGIEA